MAREKGKRRVRLPVDPNLDINGILDIERDVEREVGIFKRDSVEAEDLEILRKNQEKEPAQDAPGVSAAEGAKE